MNCSEFGARLHPYVDGELSVGETAAADAHVATCATCAALVRREQALRELLRRQPREAAPPELRSRVTATVRHEAGRKLARRAAWVVVPAVAAVLAVIVAASLPTWRQPMPLVAALVDKHIAYAQLERPAELASGNRAEIVQWFSERASMRVTVPDYSASGIRLIGARLADADERRAAYLLYEKGHTLLSVFMVLRPAGSLQLAGTPVSYRGHEYRRDERKGYRAVMWTDGQAVFGLISSLDDEALLECADRLRLERANAAKL
jgi:mycothiol system anti-sigma-R factor